MATKASTAKSFTVTHRSLGTATIEAERFERHGSGTYFYDADGGQVAGFADGEITSVVPAGVVFSGGSDGGTN